MNGNVNMFLKKFLRAVFLIVICTVITRCNQNNTEHLRSVKKIAHWLDSAAIEMTPGKTWSVDPKDPSTAFSNLYSGSAGIVLFYLEAYLATGEDSYIKQAQAGADYLLSLIPDSQSQFGDGGLYTGLSGIGFVLGETGRLCKNEKYVEGMKKCIRLFENKAEITDNGMCWTDVTDIISGNTGIGLFLLYASENFGVEEAEKMAVRTGQDLLTKAIKVETGLSWPMSPDYPRLMPNFAHGTAGTAYFLSRLYEVTKDESFLQGALAGGRRMLSLSENNLVCHHIPDGEDLFYLGWCHGPVGTGRLYHQLWKITGDMIWKTALLAGAEALLESGIPEKQTPGFWNNVGVCCGSAGVADYFLDLYKTTNKQNYLDFSRKVTRDLLNRAENDSTGMFWIQAEHRARPDLLIAQTGLMQGAAGIGLWLLKLNAFDNGRIPHILFPDRFRL
jgi:lantibiotic modifying enzyme